MGFFTSIIGFAKREQQPTKLVEFYNCGADARLNVIFIHGLGGEFDRTWMLQSDTSPWIKWVIEAFPKVRIYSLSYRIAVTRGGAMPIGARAINVLATIASVIDTKSPTILICHSYGGLLAKRMLQTSLDLAEEYAPFASSVAGIVFMGTPHSGASLATYVSAIKLIAPSTAVAELKNNQPELLQLNNWFRNRFDRLKLSVLVFYETMLTNGVLVVDEASSNPGIAGVNPIPIDSDHVDLPKPATKDVRVSRVQAFIREVAGVPLTVNKLSPMQQVIAASDGQLVLLRARLEADLIERPHDHEIRQALAYIGGMVHTEPRVVRSAAPQVHRVLPYRRMAAIASVIVAACAIPAFLLTQGNYGTPRPLDVPFARGLPVPPEIIGRDGEGYKSGQMRQIEVSLLHNIPPPDSYLARWNWSGSGGTQGGMQTAVFEFEGVDGVVVQVLKFPIQRDHCYYGAGTPQSFTGKLYVPAAEIKGLKISITEVIGPQGAC